MKILEVLPTYPGDPLDGSALHERQLNRALRERDADIEVLTTRAQKLKDIGQFLLGWPDDLPARDEHGGVPIRRFHALNAQRARKAAAEAVARRWSWEDFTEGEVTAGSARFVEFAVAQARRRPSRFDTYADIGRGPLVPGIVAHVLRHASKFDVILAAYAPFSILRQVLWAASWSKAPVVLMPLLHENDRYHQFTSLMRTYERAAAVLTSSPHTSAFLSEYAPKANPVTVGVGAIARPSDNASAARFRVRHHLEDRPVLLYVGRKEFGKRYDLAVAAMEMLPDDAVLVMVGRDADGKTIDSDRVLQLGPLSDEELADAYEACDVFILPSELESFGMVFLEAWLSAKPVIGNANCGAVAALIDHGVDGFLCRDANGIAAAARRLIEEPELGARMGAAGRAKTLSEYTWERVADRTLEALGSVARSGARA